MHDPRLTKLAEILVDHSCEVQPGEKVFIEAFDLPTPALICELIERVSERGAYPLVSCKDNTVLRTLYRNATEEGMALSGALERARMEQMDAYIGIRGASNSSQFSDVPQEKMDLYQKHWWYPVHSEIRVPRTKWVVLRYPTPSMAQAATERRRLPVDWQIHCRSPCSKSTWGLMSAHATSCFQQLACCVPGRDRWGLPSVGADRGIQTVRRIGPRVLLSGRFRESNRH